MEEFYRKAVPRDCLPSDFGGSLGSIEEMHEQFRSEYYNLREYFRAEEEQRGSCWNEILAKKKDKNTHQTEIIQNFTKLEID